MTSQLSQLVSLISNATKSVEDAFAKTAKPDVPSLDDTTPHPLDDQVSSTEMREAIQTIEGACAQLCALVAHPNRAMLNRVFNMFEPACIRAVINFNIADHLLDKPEGVHMTELGKLSGVEPRKLGRIMRLLASNHCFREVNPNVFANNRLSMMLLSTNGASAFSDLITDETNKAAAMLTENLKDPDWGHSYSPTHTPFNSWSKYPGTIFSWYQGPGTDIGAAKGIRFGKGMKGWGDFLETSAVVNVFPWSDLRDGAIVCDMGGGIGVVSMQLVDAYPNLHIVLQDVPAQIEVAKNEVWPKFCPMAIGEGRVEFKTMDFFAELPVKGCDVYFVKNILHDWPDKECKMILRNLVNAMSANSRLLINDYIIQHVNRDSNTPESVSDLKLAPEPLLPNYGAGGMTQYNMDLAVMCLFNSQERTLEHFIEMCQEVGLKFVRVWDAGETSVIEFCLE
ncbi:S-adenosyl-L-methionine-dependent methyltransferase [Guyanagaster necrorhizus]|uniref:S-adenosyl-L-methionine-dependent methyltransferase n=1 Tax=Guyanagaster necrorhizus TaxID=856835 RepID=A0A9P7VEX4_9AGAR|nr:S-adenosyl-L-methionine-dependent methyltransferase [Guyanagaster necrorhizus MCA 3950]KAG7439317.1 S-adenosyl-L-methionine-dependent methyltransferase [Guyanagaster necrorhizus MCA 3950]